MRSLSAELELLRGEGAYIDWQRLNGGDFYNEAFARALYESVCMILIYQPNYFDQAHPYCAREYRAMCELERERLALLPPMEQTHGLIIPCVLRGEDAIPQELASTRHYEDFSKFMLVDAEMSTHPLYAQNIRRLAHYIDQRC